MLSFIFSPPLSFFSPFFFFSLFLPLYPSVHYYYQVVQQNVVFSPKDTIYANADQQIPNFCPLLQHLNFACWGKMVIT